MPMAIEGHIRGGMGRNWDVSMPAPTPVHRKAIGSVRDLYDLVCGKREEAGHALFVTLQQ